MLRSSKHDLGAVLTQRVLGLVLIASLALVFAASAVADEVVPASPGEAPRINTVASEEEGAHAEQISAFINPEGQETEYHINYALSSSEWCGSDTGVHSETTTLSRGAGTAFVATEVVVNSLTPGGSYCARVVAKNATGTTESLSTTFTVGLPFIRGFSEAGSLKRKGATSVEVSGAVNPMEQSTVYYAEYAPQSSEWCASGNGVPMKTTETSVGATGKEYYSVTGLISGLTPGTTYCIYFVASNASGKAYQGRSAEGVPEFYFEAGILPLVEVTHSAWNSREPEAATLYGLINPEEQSTYYRAEYALESSEWCRNLNEGGGFNEEPTDTAYVPLGSQDTENHPVSVKVTGLTPEVSYCGTIAAYNTTGEGFERYYVDFKSFPASPLFSNEKAPSTPIEHVAPAPMRNTVLPVINGKAKKGVKLTVSPGSWEGAFPFTFSYQWEQCNSKGKKCKAIKGATKSSFKLGAKQVKERIIVVVTARNSVGATSAIAKATAVVKK